MKIKAANNFVLLDLKLKDIADNGMVIEDEISGDGGIMPCITLEKIKLKDLDLKKGSIVYVPFYALRQIKENIYVTEKESIVAYE